MAGGGNANQRVAEQSGLREDTIVPKDLDRLIDTKLDDFVDSTPRVPARSRSRG